jgi:hypothetical protein
VSTQLWLICVPTGARQRAHTRAHAQAFARTRDFSALKAHLPHPCQDVWVVPRLIFLSGVRSGRSNLSSAARSPTTPLGLRKNDTPCFSHDLRQRSKETASLSGSYLWARQAAVVERSPRPMLPAAGENASVGTAVAAKLRRHTRKNQARCTLHIISVCRRCRHLTSTQRSLPSPPAAPSSH